MATSSSIRADPRDNAPRSQDLSRAESCPDRAGRCVPRKVVRGCASPSRAREAGSRRSPRATVSASRTLPERLRQGHGAISLRQLFSDSSSCVVHPWESCQAAGPWRCRSPSRAATATTPARRSEQNLPQERHENQRERQRTPPRRTEEVQRGERNRERNNIAEQDEQWTRRPVLEGLQQLFLPIFRAHRALTNRLCRAVPHRVRCR